MSDQKECSKCGNIFYAKAYPDSQSKYPDLCFACRTHKEEEDSMMRLVGRKVLQVKYYKDTDTYIIFFDGEPNLYLTAEDGEYGDNAFKFLT